jgi:hypothetical protein
MAYAIAMFFILAFNAGHAVWQVLQVIFVFLVNAGIASELVGNNTKTKTVRIIKWGKAVF